MPLRLSTLRRTSAPITQLQSQSSQSQSRIQFQARRQYTNSPVRGYPTAIARAERAADLKKHPESALTQQKQADKKGNRHWIEENATLSEADIRADHENGEQAEKTDKAAAAEKDAGGKAAQ